MTKTSQTPAKILLKKKSKAEVAADSKPTVTRSAKGKEKEAPTPVLSASIPADDSSKKKRKDSSSAVTGEKSVKKKRKAGDVEHLEEDGEAAKPLARKRGVKTQVKTPGQDLEESHEPVKPKKIQDSARSKLTKPSMASVSAHTTRKSKTTKVPSPPEQEEEAEETEEVEDAQVEEEGADDDADDESVHLFGFSTDEDGSSDEELMDEDEAPGIDVKKLPTITKDDAVVKKKLEKAKKKPSADRGVVYLGKIPHGFYEDQMRSYFNQFGDVTRLRLSRNKRTGQSKHYGFIEFESASVAQIVAETMDNYLLMGHILSCKVIPKDEVHPELWVGANRKWRKVPRDRIARLQHNKPRTEEEQGRAEKRLLKRQAQKKRKLAEAGIDYNFDAIAYKPKPKPKPVEV